MVLTDRAPDDPDWKGALAWRIILSLAESHHEVLTVVPMDLERVTYTHPRLEVIRPVTSWSARHLPNLMRTLLLFKPQVIHTFALQPSRRWGPATVWPYFHAACSLIPEIKRVSTFFEESEMARDARHAPGGRN